MRASVVALLAACLPGALLAQAVAPAPAPASSPAAAAAVPGDIPVAAGEGREVALKLADQLVGSFVFRDQAEAYAAMLRKNAAEGRYDTGTRGEVAKRLTDDLQAVHKDGHLAVDVARPEERRAGSGGDGPPPNFPPLIQSAKTIAPGIGYIRFSGFFGTEEEMAGVRKWLAENREARTLIF